MKLKEPKKEWTRVILKDSNSTKSISFTVYDIKKESLSEFIKEAIRDSCS